MTTLTKDKVFPRQKMVEVVPYETAQETLNKRFYRKNVLGFEAPQTAISATYVDDKCPFTGNVNVRGKIFEGIVIKMRAPKTAVIRINRLKYDDKYKRYVRKNTKLITHLSPCFNGLVHVGDTVICGETRPLSKTKHSVILSVKKHNSSGHVKILKK